MQLHKYIKKDDMIALSLVVAYACAYDLYITLTYGVV